MSRWHVRQSRLRYKAVLEGDSLDQKGAGDRCSVLLPARHTTMFTNLLNCPILPSFHLLHLRGSRKPGSRIQPTKFICHTIGIGTAPFGGDNLLQ